MDDVQPETTEREDNAERPDPARLRYWAQLIKLLRDPWPPRLTATARSPEPPRSFEPARQPTPPRLADEAAA